ncbi:hypothetical protein BKA70DRAFT_1333411 [Coprinopsis sp. MPI-PUGE-AT-0042]|nr:hypothetical protein BKA70DRAFT_1333411 [Coprinopsis sp. MPI-PUGE-AT-0042]
MAEDIDASGCERAFSPSKPPHPPGSSSITGQTPRNWPENYGNPLPSELPTPSTGPGTNSILYKLFHGVWPRPEHRPTSASIPTSNARLFQGGSNNALNNSTASMANRDIWNLSNVHIHLPHASPTPLYIFVFSFNFCDFDSPHHCHGGFTAI